MSGSIKSQRNSTVSHGSSVMSRMSKGLSSVYCFGNAGYDLDHFNYLINHEHGLILVNFTAKWCGACKKSKPNLKTIRKKYPELVFLEVDIDDCDDIAEDRDVTAIPVNIFYQNGQEVDRISGYDEKYFVSDLSRVIENNIKTHYDNMFNIKNKGNFSYIIEETRGLVVFWSTANWCGGCQVIAPSVIELASRYKDVTFCKVDVDENDAVSEHLGVSRLPMFHFFRDGKLLKDVVGGTKSSLKRLIEHYRKSQFHKNEVILIKNKEQFDRSIKPNNKVILVYFYDNYKNASKMADIQLMKCADSHTNYKFYKYDLQDKPKVVEKLGINSLPVLISYMNGTAKSQYSLDKLDVLKLFQTPHRFSTG